MQDQAFVQSELNRCNKCGYCMQSCPVYRSRHDENHVARGRNQTLQHIVDGGEFDRDMLQPFFDCLLCGACTVDCFGKVRTKDLMVRAREAYSTEMGRPTVQKYLFNNLLPDPPRLRALLKLAMLGKKTGLAGLARKTGLLKWVSPALAAAESMMEEAPKGFLTDDLACLGFKKTEVNGISVFRAEPENASGPEVLYFIACGVNCLLPSAGEAAIRLMLLGGCRVTIAPNNCCGLPPWSYGDMDAARKLAGSNAKLFGKLGIDHIITECGSCSGFLKEYAEVLPDDSDAKWVAEHTLDITQFLPTLSLPKVEPRGITVTYHDPCHLGRSQNIKDDPRKLLTDAGGYTLIEMAESNWCCGGAGSYNLTHPELSTQILDRKISRIADTHAQIVTTACPACTMQLSTGLRRHGMACPTRHVVELVAESQGLVEG